MMSFDLSYDMNHDMIDRFSLSTYLTSKFYYETVI